MTKHRFKTSPFWAIAVAAALGMGLSACGGGSSNDGLSAAEEDALRQQVADAEAAKDQAEADKNKAEADKKALEDANTTAMNAADRAAMVAKGKALYSKLFYDSGTVALDMGKLSVNPAPTPPASANADGVTDLAKTDAMVATMGDWMGAHYMKTINKTAKTAAEARVYSNSAAPTQVAFTSQDATHGLTLTGVTDDGDAYSVNESHASDIMLTGLGTSGTKTLTKAEEAAGIKGSFMGAAGTYKCSNSCTAAPGATGGVTLGGDGTWTFTPDAGVMLSKKDSAYLYFGWWVRTADGEPTYASAFYNMMGVDAVGNGSGHGLTGTAEYMGKAAGKFAIRYGDTANGGHFTANAMLNAKFSGDKSGLSGTIDNFRLNDGSDNPGWSVSLKQASWADADNKYMSDGTAATGTEWSIGGNDPVPGQTGQWEAKLFDETGGKDNNTSPTTVVGKFEAGFGGTHKMVGAFGAMQ